MADKSSRGVPTKTRSASRKARRIKNWGKQPERKLRHILHHMRGITPSAKVREAFEWASNHNALAVLRQLRPEYQKELAAIGFEAKMISLKLEDARELKKLGSVRERAVEEAGGVGRRHH